MSDRTPIRILTVCSHNRTRSVMMAALLDSMLTDRLGEGAVQVRSSGFGPEGIPAIDDAVAAMRRRGLDVADHRSRSTTAAVVDSADVIIASERVHVVNIAALSPPAFRRAMTLPELILRVGDAPLDPSVTTVDGWVTSLTADRTAGAYLRASVPEVVDPTGSMPRAFEAAVLAIERQCADVSDAIARIAHDLPPPP